jgi:hypothetical protein
MTQGERDTLQMVIVRLEAMLGDLPDYKSQYGGDLLTEGQSPFVRSWILYKLRALATPAAERTHVHKSSIRHTQLDWQTYQRRLKQKALKLVTETQTGGTDGG